MRYSLELIKIDGIVWWFADGRATYVDAAALLRGSDMRETCMNCIFLGDLGTRCEVLENNWKQINIVTQKWTKNWYPMILYTYTKSLLLIIAFLPRIRLHGHSYFSSMYLQILGVYCFIIYMDVCRFKVCPKKSKHIIYVVFSYIKNPNNSGPCQRSVGAEEMFYRKDSISVWSIWDFDGNCLWTKRPWHDQDVCG